MPSLPAAQVQAVLLGGHTLPKTVPGTSSLLPAESPGGTVAPHRLGRDPLI